MSEFTWDVSDFRTRYTPGIQFGHGLIMTAPWINIGLLVFFFLLLPMNFIVREGVRVELPTSPALMGARYGMSVVVLSQPGEHHGAEREVVFFDDQPFNLEQTIEQAALGNAFQAVRTKHPELVLTIIGDRGIRLGTITLLFKLALKAGIKSVHIATSSGAQFEVETP